MYIADALYMSLSMKAPLQPAKRADAAAPAQRVGTPAEALVDNRPQAAVQRELQDVIAQSPRQAAQRAAVATINNSPRMVAQRQAAAQLQVRPNRTGLPDKLKAGVENLSGHSLDDVRVHYNSDKPAQLQAHAYAQGTEIHIAPGQEKHLPHEAWHMVQQKQGRVRPTRQLMGVGVNDAAGLEKEAAVMGERAAQLRKLPGLVSSPAKVNAPASTTVQRVVWDWLAPYLGISAIVGIGAGVAYHLWGLQKGAKSSSSADEKKDKQPSLNDSSTKNPSASKPKTEITHTSGYVTDPKGKHHEVGKEVNAKLAVEDEVKGSATDTNWTWMQNLRYQYSRANVVRGHLLNHDLGGFGTPENLYPISTSANRDHSVKVEQKVKKKMMEELQKIGTSDGPRRILYTVKVEEANPHEPENAKFVCSYGLEGGEQLTETITSHLEKDKGGFLKKDAAEDNPLKDTKWHHGARKGTNEGQKPTWDYYQTTKKINVNDTNKLADIKLEKNKKVDSTHVDRANTKNIYSQLTVKDGGIFKENKGFSLDVKKIISKKLGYNNKFEDAVINIASSTESYREITRADEIKLLMVQIVGEQLQELSSWNKTTIAHYLENNEITTTVRSKKKIDERPAEIEKAIAKAITSVNEYENELIAIIQKPPTVNQSKQSLNAQTRSNAKKNASISLHNS